MTEKPKPTKPPKPATRPGYEHWGELQPVKYGDSLGKRIGNKLLGWLTVWSR